MSVRLAALCIAALALASAAGAAPAFKATFNAPTHTPKVNAKWFYTVRVTNLHGKSWQPGTPTSSPRLPAYARNCWP